MGRILAIDYGTKRTGLAVTDPLQIIATALDTVETKNAIPYIKKYASAEPLDAIVIGLPKKLNNTDSDAAPLVRQFVVKLNKELPNTKVHTVDERFTSSIAKRTMIEGGMKKKDRREKGNVDKISATLILQTYLESRR